MNPAPTSSTGGHALVWDAHDTDPGASMQYFQLTTHRLVALDTPGLRSTGSPTGSGCGNSSCRPAPATINDVVASASERSSWRYDDRLRGLSADDRRPDSGPYAGVVSSSARRRGRLGLHQPPSGR